MFFSSTSRERKKCFPVSNYPAKMIRFVLNESCYEAAIVERMSHSIDCLPLPPPGPAGERLLMAAAPAGMYGGRRQGRPQPGSWQHADVTPTGRWHSGEREAKQRGDTTQLHLVIYSHIVNIEMYSLQTRQASMLGATRTYVCSFRPGSLSSIVLLLWKSQCWAFFTVAFSWGKFHNFTLP